MSDNSQLNGCSECCCCCESVHMKDMVKCSKGHLICKKCIETQVKEGISRATANDKCPCMDGCDSHIPTSELEKVLTKETMEKFDEIEADCMLSKADIPYLRKCWKCAYYIIDEDENCPMKCPECNEKTCKKCGKKNHPGRTCQEADMDPMRLVEDMMSKAVVKECPGCHIHYFKNEGCNHMTGTKCNIEFCHLCGAIITGKVSEHFKSCQQSIDNIKYNEEQIQKARNEGLHKYEISV